MEKYYRDVEIDMDLVVALWKIIFVVSSRLQFVNNGIDEIAREYPEIDREGVNSLHF